MGDIGSGAIAIEIKITNDKVHGKILVMKAIHLILNFTIL